VKKIRPWARRRKAGVNANVIDRHEDHDRAADQVDGGDADCEATGAEAAGENDALMGPT